MLYCVHLFVLLGMATHPCKKKLQGILFLACVGITEKILSVHACYYVLLGFFFFANSNPTSSSICNTCQDLRKFYIGLLSSNSNLHNIKLGHSLA